MVKLVNDLSNNNSAEITEYINRITSLESEVENKELEILNNKSALVNALKSKNIECSIDETYTSLVGKIDLFTKLSQDFVIYDNGTVYQALTPLKGKSNAGTITMNSDHIQLYGPAGSWIEAGVVNTNTIDFSKYKTLYVDCECIGSSYSSYGINLGYSTASSRPTAFENNFKGIDSDNKSITVNNRKIVTWDISSVASTMKWFYLYEVYATIKIYEIWLK